MLRSHKHSGPSAPGRQIRRMGQRGLTVFTLLLLALLPLPGSIGSATSASPLTTGRVALDPTSATSRQAQTQMQTPKVTLTLRKKRVSTKQHARVEVVVRPRARQSAAERALQSQSLRTGRIKIVVNGGGESLGVRARLVDRKALVTLPKLSSGVYRVSATFLGNKVLGKSSSRPHTLTVTLPSDTSGSGSSSCPLPDYPNASCTGVPAGTNLVPYTGSSTISTANAVIEGKTLGCIQVTAPGVVIRDSRISCRNPGSVVVASFDGDYSGTPLLLEDVEIDCQNGPGTAVGDALVTVRRANIHGCENGFDLNQNVTVEDSYVHDMWNSSASHTDGIQLAGHLVGSGYVAGALNITIRHNTIYGVGADGSLGTSAIIANRSGDVNVLIQDNLLAGGAYTLYCDAGTASQFRVIGNHFSRRFSSAVGAYGPSDGCANDTQSGNVYHESGAALHLD
jgi:hypothetical protein